MAQEEQRDAERPIRRIFISYARANRPQVAPLAEELGKAGFEIWWDALMEGGARFAHKIEAQLEEAEAVIVVWSVASVKSDWVRDEAASARDVGKLVSVSLDGSEPPLGFRQYHAVDLSGWRRDPAAPEFQAVLAGIGGAAPRARAASPRPAWAGARVSRRATIAGAGAAVAAAATAGLVAFHPWRAAAADNSVAVLPFRNLSGDASQDYLSAGLAEEVRSALTRNAALRVAAPTSSSQFHDGMDARSIGARLQVAHLLEGSVRKSGNVVRVSAELIDSATGFTNWSQDFQRQLSDVFAVETEIASTVAEALAVRVAQPKDSPGTTRNPEAYDDYLRGLALFNADSGEASDRAALALFEAAVALDPAYAKAHAARSRSLAGIATQYASADMLKPMYEQAIEAARRAVALAPALAAGQLALGYALFTGHLDFRAARQPFEQAAALGAGDADILVLYGLYAARAGMAARAADAVGRALQRDRLNPRAWRASASVAYAAGHFADVLPPANQALALNSRISNAHAMVGNALFALGRTEEARNAYRAEPNSSFRLTGLAIAEHKLGNADAAKQAKADLISELGDSALYQQAEIAAQWGDANGALDALEKASRVGDSGLLYMPTDPMLQTLRGTPRYAQLLKRMNFA